MCTQQARGRLKQIRHERAANDATHNTRRTLTTQFFFSGRDGLGVIRCASKQEIPHSTFPSAEWLNMAYRAHNICVHVYERFAYIYALS